MYELPNLGVGDRVHDFIAWPILDYEKSLLFATPSETFMGLRENLDYWHDHLGSMWKRVDNSQQVSMATFWNKIELPMAYFRRWW